MDELTTLLNIGGVPASVSESATHVGEDVAAPSASLSTGPHRLGDEGEDEEGEVVEWSNFKPPHGNKGMTKFGGRPAGAGNKYTGIKDWQRAIVDFTLLHPAAKRAEIADHVGVTPEWLSRVMNSDAFIKYREGRYKEHQHNLSESIVSTAGEVALTGLTKINQRMKSSSDSLEMGDMVKATEMAGKMLGLGVAKPAQGTAVQINNIGVDPGLLAAARKKMELIGQVNTNERLRLEEEEKNVDVFAPRRIGGEIEQGVEDAEEIGEVDELLDQITQGEGRKGLDAAE